jgi:steroid delta-isomerase-like uncharacterized protein
VTSGVTSVDAIMDAWEAAWSGKSAGDFAAVCAGGVQYEDPLTGGRPLQGVDALSVHATRLWSAFPDVRLEKTGARLSDGRYVAAPAKLLGTHRATLEGLPATNRFVVMHCMFYCELAGDRLLRVRGFFDVYEAAMALGVLPGRGSVGEKALLMLRGFGLRTGRS